tara:strand:- start:369 stop:506 length:138 start_codon:yes stop_codon:yes gene_type:complete
MVSGKVDTQTIGVPRDGMLTHPELASNILSGLIGRPEIDDSTLQT